MAAHQLIQREFKTLFAGVGAQMILCSYRLLGQWEHDNLSAPFWRWYWNDSPGATVRAGRQVIELEPRRVVLIPPNTAFATTTAATVGHLYCHFSTSARLAPQFKRPIVRGPSDEEIDSIREVAALMQNEATPNDWPAVFAMNALVSAAVAAIPATHWQTPTADANIGRVLAAMHERPSEAFDNDALADIASLSTNSLLRRFKGVTGTTPHRYLSRLRVENTSIDLRTTDDSLDRIAARNGFCDRFHCSRVFKQFTQASPAAYRAARRRQAAAE